MISPLAYVHPDAKLGNNVTVEPFAYIAGDVEIGDDCWIGTNAVIVGNVKIGSDVLIAPLTYVNFDVPDHSIVVGNPGRIIPRENATKDYICNRV